MRRKIQCLLFLLRYGAYFLARAYLSAQAFDALSSNLELCDFNLRRLGRRSYSLTLLRDALNTITLEIVIWYGAVIMLGVRQSGENRPQ